MSAWLRPMSTREEDACPQSCLGRGDSSAYLAVAVLAGLLANSLFGTWWLDPVVALAIAAPAVTEGRRAWRGESCGFTGCATGRVK